MKKLAKFALVIGSIATANMSFAQKAGDFIAGIGGAYIVPNASVGTLSSSSSAIQTALLNSTASIGSTSTLVFSGLYMWTDNVATELTIGIPPSLTVDLVSPNAGVIGQPTNHPGAATAKALTPSLVGKYLFNNPGDTWRPYLGLGFTYASFSDVTPNSSDPTVALLAKSASLSSSFAPVFNAGTIYNIDNKWSINASISYVPLKSDVTFISPAGSTTTGTLTINPIEYVVRLGYKF